jgi:hypothetical protein
MDDMAVTTSTPLKLQHIIRDLSTVFEIVDLGELKWMLGIAITWDHAVHTLTLCQSTYINKITHWFNLEHATPAHIPLDPHVNLMLLQSPSTEAEVLSMAHVLYCTLIGSIMYTAICSQPDIMFGSTLDCHEASPPISLHHMLPSPHT